MWHTDNLEEGALQTLDEATCFELRSLAADESAADTDELQQTLRACAFQAVSKVIGDSPLASAALAEIDWDIVVDEVCRIDTIEIPSPCCASTVTVRSKGGLVAREHGRDTHIETSEHRCGKCHRCYLVTVHTTVKGDENTNREIVFANIPDETVTYVHNEHRSHHGHSRSVYHCWKPLADGTPVLARHRDDTPPF